MPETRIPWGQIIDDYSPEEDNNREVFFNDIGNLHSIAGDIFSKKSSVNKQSSLIETSSSKDSELRKTIIDLNFQSIDGFKKMRELSNNRINDVSSLLIEYLSKALFQKDPSLDIEDSCLPFPIASNYVIPLMKQAVEDHLEYASSTHSEDMRATFFDKFKETPEIDQLISILRANRKQCRNCLEKDNCDYIIKQNSYIPLSDLLENSDAPFSLKDFTPDDKDLNDFFETVFLKDNYPELLSSPNIREIISKKTSFFTSSSENRKSANRLLSELIHSTSLATSDVCFTAQEWKEEYLIQFKRSALSIVYYFDVYNQLSNSADFAVTDLKSEKIQQVLLGLINSFLWSLSQSFSDLKDPVRASRGSNVLSLIDFEARKISSIINAIDDQRHRCENCLTYDSCTVSKAKKD